MARVYDVRMAHHEEPQVTAHRLGSISQGMYLENFHPQRDPIWHNLVANRPAASSRCLHLPDGPGLGGSWTRTTSTGTGLTTVRPRPEHDGLDR